MLEGDRAVVVAVVADAPMLHHETGSTPGTTFLAGGGGRWVLLSITGRRRESSRWEGNPDTATCFLQSCINSL